jgi:hypothetical protein
MPRFLLLSREPNGAPPFSPEEFQRVMQRYYDWSSSLRQRTNVLAIAGLPKDQARVLRGQGGEMVVTDGPFTESTEVLGGYWLFEAASFDEALELVKEHPHFGFGLTLELRLVELVS